MKYYLEMFGRTLIASLLITLTGEMLMEESIIFYFIVLGLLITWVGIGVEEVRDSKQRGNK